VHRFFARASGRRRSARALAAEVGQSSLEPRLPVPDVALEAVRDVDRRALIHLAQARTHPPSERGDSTVAVGEDELETVGADDARRRGDADAARQQQRRRVPHPARLEVAQQGFQIVVHLVERQNTLPARQEQPRDSGIHARNGGGGDAPGLPSGSGAPSAPATSASTGHDGPGGARHPFAVHTDDVTTTQLKLIGTSRDHDVDGAGREAALPTTSPD